MNCDYSAVVNLVETEKITTYNAKANWGSKVHITEMLYRLTHQVSYVRTQPDRCSCQHTADISDYLRLQLTRKESAVNFLKPEDNFLLSSFVCPLHLLTL